MRCMWWLVWRSHTVLELYTQRDLLIKCTQTTTYCFIEFLRGPYVSLSQSWYPTICSKATREDRYERTQNTLGVLTLVVEVGCVTAKDSQGIVWGQWGLADGCDEGVAGRDQAQTTTQRRHGQLRLQDALCRRLISTGGGRDTQRVMGLEQTRRNA